MKPSNKSLWRSASFFFFPSRPTLSPPIEDPFLPLRDSIVGQGACRFVPGGGPAGSLSQGVGRAAVREGDQLCLLREDAARLWAVGVLGCRWRWATVLWLGSSSPSSPLFRIISGFNWGSVGTGRRSKGGVSTWNADQGSSGIRAANQVFGSTP